MSLVLVLPLMNRQNLIKGFLQINDPSSWESPRDICPFNDFIGRILNSFSSPNPRTLYLVSFIRHPLQIVFLISRKNKLIRNLLPCLLIPSTHVGSDLK